MRKLSKLQKFILRLAHQKGVIRNPDVLQKWYGFQPVSSGKLRFNRRKVGVYKYLSCTVAVSRSITRLRLRGLIDTSPGQGHYLTSGGEEIVVKLMETVD